MSGMESIQSDDLIYLVGKLYISNQVQAAEITRLNEQVENLNQQIAQTNGKARSKVANT